jgi:glycosyltransferase involved in cell wall biosynthesis
VRAGRTPGCPPGCAAASCVPGRGPPEAIDSFTGADPPIQDELTMNQKKVSIVTPTWNREAFLPSIHACVRRQSYENFEWLVLDDSEKPSEELSTSPWNKLRYIHSAERLSIGEKRNRLIAEASGDIIVNFDDDDFYGPAYVTDRIAGLEASGHKLSLMSGFFAFHLNTGHFGYYKTLIKSGLGFRFNKQGVEVVDLGQVNIPYIHLCYGWSYVFHKEIWDHAKFSDLMIFEDREFVRSIMDKFKIHFYESRKIDAIHSIHSLSSSNCFPQFLIPPFMMSAESEAIAGHVERLRAVVRDLAAAAEPGASEATGSARAV